MCPACPRTAGGPGRNDGSSYTARRLPRGTRPPMPSSPVPAARCHYLLDLLAQVPDPRKRRGRRHALAGLLAVGIAAVIARSRAFAPIAPCGPGADIVIPSDTLQTQSHAARHPLRGSRNTVRREGGNAPALPRPQSHLPGPRTPATSWVSKGHGRRARRTIKVALAPAWIGF